MAADRTLEALITRPINGTEHTWVRAARGGTGVSVCALHLSKPPDPDSLENTLHKILNSHPILRSHLAPTGASFTIPTTPHLRLRSLDLSTTAAAADSIPPFELIIQHELNQNPWSTTPTTTDESQPTMFATLYALPEAKWAAAVRALTAVCDRTAAVGVLKEVKMGIWGEGIEGGFGGEDGVNLGIEKLVPTGKGSKALWARGFDLVGYSLNSFRLSNLPFKDTASTRSSAFVRMRFDSDETSRLLSGMRGEGMKVCGAMGAAGMMAAHASKRLPEHQWEKYGIVTLIDCRKSLYPPLHPYNFGFYHSAIINTHDVRGEGNTDYFWDLAKRCYTSFNYSKNSNKHFTDLNDVNLLMCKAIDNPGLTPSSSLRTSFMALWEDPKVVDDDSSKSVSQDIGLLDCIDCASVHGVGSSIAVFDTIRDGALECTCVYPSPLHSREQMEELVMDMKRILIEGSLNF
ncbi:hypothetical protein Syun_016618 [Stephania yunnanensis]|uniref:Uncharacterized protein n=1 Tax=Stephania yunnanensis TaxID=152371 RepID=A0AAP0J587_9MAGN